MNIHILCSDFSHFIYKALLQWKERQWAHKVQIIDSVKDASGGDYLFLVSCHEIVLADVRSRYRHVLVPHGSDLPEGRGWSPINWALLQGKSELTISLIEADERVDSGDIWFKRKISLEGHEVFEEVFDKVSVEILSVIDQALETGDKIRPSPQPKNGATYYKKRTPEDSRLDPNRSIAEQFDLIRASDPERYPCFFDFRGHRYTVRIHRKAKQ